MNSKEFNDKVKAIISKYSDVRLIHLYDYELDTIMGTWLFSAEYSPKIKLANIHSRFLNFDLNKFKEFISETDTPSPYSCKWNRYSKDPEFIIDLLKETLSNFEYLKLLNKK